jgi:hypothetical protein
MVKLALLFEYPAIRNANLEQTLSDMISSPKFRYV